MRLAGDLRNKFEVGVVMQHRQMASFGRRGDQCVHEGKRSMHTRGGECGLDLESSSVVSIGRRNRRKGLEAVGDLPVVVRASSRVAEFETDWIGERYPSRRRQWRKRRGHSGFGQPGENAGVDQILDACHLLAITPRSLGGFEVESALLAEQGHEL